MRPTAFHRRQPGFYIADAESEADLEELARELPAQGFHLACGSAGLARPCKG